LHQLSEQIDKFIRYQFATLLSVLFVATTIESSDVQDYRVKSSYIDSTIAARGGRDVKSRGWSYGVTTASGRGLIIRQSQSPPPERKYILGGSETAADYTIPNEPINPSVARQLGSSVGELDVEEA